MGPFERDLGGLPAAERYLGLRPVGPHPSLALPLRFRKLTPIPCSTTRTCPFSKTAAMLNNYTTFYNEAQKAVANDVTYSKVRSTHPSSNFCVVHTN